MLCSFWTRYQGRQSLTVDTREYMYCCMVFFTAYIKNKYTSYFFNDLHFVELFALFTRYTVHICTYTIDLMQIFGTAVIVVVQCRFYVTSSFDINSSHRG